MQVDLYGYDTQWPMADGSNNYCAAFGGNPGIEAEGEARIELPLGHTAYVRTRTPTTALWLNKWSDGHPHWTGITATRSGWATTGGPM